jgi:hypothetical protein
MKSGEIAVRNYKTLEEAKEILRNNIEQIYGDYVVVYKEDTSSDTEEDEDLIVVHNEADMIREEYNLNIEEVIMAGDKCVYLQPGDKVVTSFRAGMNFESMVIGDVVFFLIPERSILAKMKANV